MTFTRRRRLTKGDIEQMMRDAVPAGGTFKYINWKKRVAHLTDDNGRAFTIPLAKGGFA